MASPPVAPAKVDYPSSDGRPMAESDFQRTPLIYAVDGGSAGAGEGVG